MFELDADLPPGALCAADPGVVAEALGDVLWWHGAPGAMDRAPATGALLRWNEATGGPAALPTEPHAGREHPAETIPPHGLQCRPGTHCGMVAEDITRDAATATVAIRFRTPIGSEARTLLTLNAPEAGNYLFLSQGDGTLTAKDDRDLISIDVPCPPDDLPRLAIMSLRGRDLALSLGTMRAEGKAPTQVLQGPASLFIGCRNHRPGLLKTLGGALILDVWLFPGRALLHSDAEADRAALTALHRHHLWAAP